MYQLVWHTEDEILHLINQGTLTLDETQEQIVRLIKMLDGMSHKVSLLIDIRELGHLAFNMKFIQMSGIRAFLDHDKLATVALVGDVSPMLRFWLTILTQKYMPGYRSFNPDAMDDAVSYLLAVNRIQRGELLPL